MVWSRTYLWFSCNTKTHWSLPETWKISQMICWKQVFLKQLSGFTVGCLLICWTVGYESVSTATASSPTLIPWGCEKWTIWVWCNNQMKNVYFQSHEWTVSVMSLLMFSTVIVPDKGDGLLCFTTTVKRKADEAAAADSEWTHNKAQLRKSEVLMFVFIRLLHRFKIQGSTWKDAKDYLERELWSKKYTE